jgi:hypothetical protein
VTHPADATAHSTIRRVSFLIVLVLVSLLLILALGSTLQLLYKNWLPTEAWLRARPDSSPGDQVHRLHSLALALISWGILSGILLQFHRPRRKLGALLMAVAGVAAVTAAELITGTFTLVGVGPFLAMIFVTAALHPSARTLVRPSGVDRPMLALAFLASGPAFAYAVEVGGAARRAGGEGDVQHLTFMVTIALLVPLWASVGSLAKPGWAVPAGAAVVAGGCIGLQSLMFPDALSALGTVWASAVLVWCFAYVIAARLRCRGTPSTRPVRLARGADRVRQPEPWGGR